MTVTAYGERAEEAVKEAEEELLRLDALLSTGEESSEVAKLNQTGKGVLSEDAGFLLERSLEFYQDTEGAFDVAIYPLMQAWGVPSGDYQVPGERELARLLELADPSQILYNGGSGEDASFLSHAKGVIGRILAAQSLEVDTMLTICATVGSYAEAIYVKLFKIIPACVLQM